MLLVIAPNLAIDRILEVDAIRVHQVQRCRSVLTQPGGKGSNVARVFRQLGGEVVLIGFVGRRNGASIREPLQQMGIHVEAIEGWDGESRTCTIIRSGLSNDHPTVINEESPEVQPNAIDAINAKIDEWLSRVHAVLVTGSLSRGLPEDFYARVIERANRRKLITAIDAAGQVMRRGLEARPVLLKANFEEIDGVLGPLPAERTQLAGAIQEMRGLAPSQTIITLGEAGAVLITQEEAWWAKPPRISTVNPIGAGDAFAAGYLKSLMDGATLETALRFAVGVAAADVATPQPGYITPSELAPLVSSVHAERIGIKN